MEIDQETEFDERYLVFLYNTMLLYCPPLSLHSTNRILFYCFSQPFLALRLFLFV